MKPVAIAALLVSLLPLIALSSTDARQQPPGPEATVPGQILVRLEEGADPAEILPSVAQYNERLGVWRITTETARGGEDLAEALAGDPNVSLVQPQHVYTNASEPGDELYRTKQAVQYRVINLQAAWDVIEDADPVVVAVVDGGVDILHPDLDSRIWHNSGEVAGNQVDDDTNGCTDDVTGCSFHVFPPSGDVHDDDGHGTFVAGLIAAETDGAGTVGVAPNAQIMPVRALDSNGNGSTEQLAESILYAARNGADVINLSLVMPPIAGECPRDEIVEAVLQEARDVQGATVVAASGNFGLPCVGFPASSQYSIAVGASGPAEDSDAQAAFSQWGPELAVAAPGVAVTSTCPIPTNRRTPWCSGEPYGTGDGTSFSTPIAAGVAALVLGNEPSMTPAEMRNRLVESARDVPDENRPHWDGGGMLDAGAALGAGSAFTSFDVRGRDLTSLRASLVAGSCNEVIWDRADHDVRSVASMLGVGACANEWPPSGNSPWSLMIEAGDGKAATLQSWSLVAGGLACSYADTPVVAPPGVQTSIDIACSSNTHVANHNAAAAATVPVDALPRRYEQDVRYATTGDDPTPSCIESASRGVWYRLPAGGAGESFAADTLGSTFDTVLAVYRQDGGALSEVACNDDVDFTASRVVWTSDGWSPYFVLVSALASVPAHTLRLNISPVLVPENDVAGLPLTLDPLSTHAIVQPGHAATTGADDPEISCSPPYGSSLWYTVTAPEAGTLTVTTQGSSYDTVLGVFQQGPSGLEEIACNDEAQSGVHTSLATWVAEPGRQYLVMVGSFRIRAAGTLKIQALR